MAITIEMPKLSDTMSVGTVVKWHKQVGDQVENGDTLAEIETDKATMELENFDDGVLLKILVEEGAEAPIGSPLAIVGEEGESIEEIDTQAIEETVPEEKPEPISLEKTDDSSNLSAEKNLEVTTTEPASLNELKDTETKAEDPPGKKVNTSSDRIFVSPLAKKMADEKNIDLANITGSGPSGRIIKKDILATEVSHSDKNHDPVLPANVSEEQVELPTLSSNSGLLIKKSVPLSGMRTVIATRLTESKSTIPHFYLQKEINIEPLLDTRTSINEIFKERAELTKTSFNKFSVNDFILKACAESIKWHPEINTSWGNKEISYHAEVNLAFGVAVEGGLLTPVINNADQLSLEEVSLEAKSLINKARSKKLLPEAMSGSTFTVTNLGMFGIDFFSGIINPPNAAILSVGSSIEKPVVNKRGKVVAGKTLTLGLSCDHRLVDGAIGAGFLKTLSNYLENPACMLI